VEDFRGVVGNKKSQGSLPELQPPKKERKEGGRTGIRFDRETSNFCKRLEVEGGGEWQKGRTHGGKNSIRDGGGEGKKAQCVREKKRVLINIKRIGWGQTEKTYKEESKIGRQGGKSGNRRRKKK